MSPKCHESKKEAIFQLCNFLCYDNISGINDLANGEVLFKAIKARFPLFSEVEVQSSEVDVLGNNTESNAINIKNENPEPECNPATKEKYIFLQHIKKFIDDNYNINSDNIIDYKKCIKFDEFEVLKVAVFVISEITRLLVETKSKDLMTVTHFDDIIQVELEEIFQLFITDREKLNKEVIEKLFSRKSKKASPLGTPRRISTRNMDKVAVSSPDDVFSSSPLKIYFESSPLFKKKGTWLKEKVKCYEKTLKEGEEQVSKLENKITELENVLKDKEKDLNCLQRKLQEKEEENQNLLRDIESLMEKTKRLSAELTKRIEDNEFLKGRVEELDGQNDDIKEENYNSKSSSRLHENSVLNSKEEEIKILKEKVKNLEIELNSTKHENMFLKGKVEKLEIKNISYRDELAAKMRNEIEITNKNSPGAVNGKYEEMWCTRELKRIETEEVLSTAIIQNNKDLISRLNHVQSEKEKLHKELINLKIMLNGKNRKSGSTELKDSSKTPETEQFRKSFNETSFILNNSDYLIPCEQSIISSEPEALPCSEKPSEAVLWKMYDFQDIETRSTCNINLNHHSIDSNLDVINDLQLSNIKIENIEQDTLLNQKNKYLLGNLNFDAFLNELKKLTKNGSFHKVLQVFVRRQKEINEANGCSRLDLQEMLKIITECVGSVVAHNTESSVCDLKDKCCSTDEKELGTIIELNIELDRLKNQLSAASQKHENNLKGYKNELEKLAQEKKKVENESKIMSDKIFKELYRKYKQQIMKNDHLNRKWLDLKNTYENLLDNFKQQQAKADNIKKVSLNVCKKKVYYEKQHKLSQEENIKLKQDLLKLKEENETLLKEKEAWSVGSAACLRDSLPSRDSCVGLSNHLNMKPEFCTSTLQETTSNESVLSGAFHKSAFYVSENEDDFCYYNSLNPVKKEYKDDRIDEIKRRNSLYPRQLQSSYPLEADLNATYHSLYVQDQCREQQLSKKRKLAAMELEVPSHYVVKTPVRKPKKEFITPSSLRKLIQRKQKPVSVTSKSKP